MESPYSRPTPPAPLDPLIVPAEPVEWIDPYDQTYKRRWAALVAILILTVIVFYPALQGSLLWGDDQAVANNPALRSSRALGYAIAHPRASATGYRPLADTLFYGQYRLWSEWNPTGYHVISLALHLLNVALFWLILRRLRVRGVILAAAIFALHPAGVQAVGWIARQPSLWATFFCLAATLAYFRVVGMTQPDDDSPPRTGLWRIIFFTFAACALLCDATHSAGLPIALLAVRGWQTRQINRRDIVELLPVLALSVAMLLVTIISTQRQPDLPGRLTFRILASGWGTLWHLLTLVDPWPMLFAYRGGRHLSPLLHISALLVVLLALAWLWKRRPNVFAIATIVLALLLPPLIFLSLPQPSWVIDSQQYLARTAIIALIAATLTHRLSTDAGGIRHFALPVAFVAIVAVLSSLSWHYGSTYADNRTLWSNVAEHDSKFALAHAQLAAVLMDEGDVTGGATQLDKLVALDPNNATSHMRLAEALLQQGKTPEAVEHLRTAVQLRAADASTHRTLASALAQQGDRDTAEKEFRQAIELDPRDDLARNNYATFLANAGRMDEAIKEYQRAIDANPNSSMAHLHLASVLFATGKFNDAAQHLQTAVKLDPLNYSAYMTSGAMLMKFNDAPNAARMFRHAVALRQDARTQRGKLEQAQAFNALGVALLAQGSASEADYNFGRAIDLNPDYAEAKQNRATAQAQRERVPTTAP